MNSNNISCSSNNNNNNNNNNNSNGIYIESLFWKVVRNKYLWSKIVVVENKKSYEGLVKFDEIISIFGVKLGIRIIREKVKNKHYIASCSFISILEMIDQDSIENNLFYIQLFENYNYFKNVPIAIQLIVQSSNIFAFKSYINHFKINNFQHYINQYYNTPSTSNSDSGYLKINCIKSFQFLSYLLLNHNLPIIKDYKITNQYNKCLYYWLVHYKYEPISINQLISITKSFIQLKLNKIKIFNRKDSKLNKNKIINQCLSALINHRNYEILIHKPQSSSYQVYNITLNQPVNKEYCKDIENEKRMKLKSKDYYQEALKELESLSSQFTNEELETNFIRLLTISNFISFNSTSIIVDNSKSKSVMEFINHSFIIRNSILSIIRLYFNVTHESLSIEQKRQIIFDLNSRNVVNHCCYFFKYIYNGFNGGSTLNSAMNSTIVNIYEIMKKGIQRSPILLIALLELDDLQVLEEVHKTHQDSIRQQLVGYSTLEINSLLNFNLVYVASSIKSVAVLDFLFQHYGSSTFFGSGNEFWRYLSSFELLKRFEALMGSAKKTLAINSQPNSIVYPLLEHPPFTVDREFKVIYRNTNINILQIMEYAFKKYINSNSTLEPSLYVVTSSPSFPFDIYSFAMPIQQYIRMKKNDIVFSFFKSLIAFRNHLDKNQLAPPLLQHRKYSFDIISLDKLLSNYPDFNILAWIIKNQYLNLNQSSIITLQYQNYKFNMELSIQLLFYSLIYIQEYDGALDLVRLYPNEFRRFEFYESTSTTLVSIDFLIKAVYKYFQILEGEQHQNLNTSIDIGGNSGSDEETLFKSTLKLIITSFLLSASRTGNNQFFINVLHNSEDFKRYLNSKYIHGETLLDQSILSKLLKESTHYNNIELMDFIISLNHTKNK